MELALLEAEVHKIKQNKIPMKINSNKL
jgi:hypothetical protein